MLPLALVVAAVVAKPPPVKPTSGVISTHFRDSHESEGNNHSYPDNRRGCLGCKLEKLILHPPPYHLICLGHSGGLVKRSPVDKKTKGKKKKKQKLIKSKVLYICKKKKVINPKVLHFCKKKKNVKTQVKVSNSFGKTIAKIGLPVTFIQAPVQTTITITNKFIKVFHA